MRGKTPNLIHRPGKRGVMCLSPRFQIAPMSLFVAIQEGRCTLRRISEHLQAIGSILPPTGISGAVLLSVMTMSYLLPSRRRHWSPTSGVLVMFFCAKGGRFLPSQAMGPTTVLSLVEAIAFAILLLSPTSVERFATSIASSNSARTNLIGCVHCFPDNFSYAASAAPVAADVLRMVRRLTQKVPAVFTIGTSLDAAVVPPSTTATVFIE
jgi:hypothetical protein